MYFGYFLSVLSYGILFWGTTSIQSLTRVFRLQKKAVRIVCGLGHRASCREVFPSEGLLTVPSLFIFSVSIYTFKHIQNFPVHNHNYHTRFKDQLLIPKHHSTKFEKSIEFLGPKIFNSLPSHIKNCKTENSFKSKLKSFLIERAFYAIEDFFSCSCE